MIEFRWKKEVVAQYYDGLMTGTKTYHDPVLEYRVMENIEEIGLQKPIWSEWKEVPTELIET